MDDEYFEEHTVRTYYDKITSNKTRRICIKDGDLHCKDGPAQEIFDPVSGTKISEEYHIGGWLHRPESEGPAASYWDAETGHLVYEEYNQYGNTNRSGNLPAITYYDRRTGEITHTEFHVNGEEVSNEHEPPAMI